MDKTEQLAEMVIQAAQVYMERKLADFAKALRLDERLREIEAGAGKGAAMQSLERRSSRHADHLARLESRVRALETGALPPVLLEHHEHDRQ